MDSLNLKICLFNVLITGESTFDEKSVPTAQSFIRKKVTSYKICILVNTIFFVSKIVTFFVFPCSIGYSDSLPRYYLNGLKCHSSKISYFFINFGIRCHIRWTRFWREVSKVSCILVISFVEFSKEGYKITKFCLQINNPKLNYCILRTDVAMSCQKM